MIEENIIGCSFKNITPEMNKLLKCKLIKTISN